MTLEPEIPQDLDAERALLGSMMMCADCIDEVVSIVRTDSFYVPAHTALCRVIVEIHREGKPMDIAIVADRLRSQDLLEMIGGMQYMVLLADSYAEWANAPHYARLIEEKARRRRMINIGNNLRAMAYDVSMEPEVVAAGASEKLDQIATPDAADSTVDVRDLLREIGDQLAAGSEALGYIPSPFSKYDYMFDGIELGALTLIGARTSQGKTAFSLNMAAAVVAAGHKCLFVSVEMNQRRIADRITSILTGHPSRDLRTDNRYEELGQLSHKAAETLCAKTLFLSDGKAVRRIRDIAALGRTYVRRHGVEMIVVDYLQLVDPAQRLRNRYLEVGETSRILQELAQSTGAAVVSPCQLSRDSETKPPTLRDLRESGDLEQNADVVILLWSDPKCTDLSVKMILHVAKNRNGPTGRMDVTFHKPTQTFTGAALQ